MSAKQIETLLESAPRPSSGRKRTQVSTYAADDSVGLDLVKKKARKESAASIKPNADIIQFTQPIPSRNSHGELVFADFPTFRPNLTPAEVLQLGSFGGTYYRPIYSSVTHTQYDNEAFKELPADWTAGLNIPKMVTSSTYRLGVNKYKESCGQGLEEWESSGWITAYDSYGWFQWYCRFYQGRRCPDDDRQIKRGLGVMGPKGRWKRNLVNKIKSKYAKADGKIANPEVAINDYTVSPKIRQLLQHWAYAIAVKDIK